MNTLTQPILRPATHERIRRGIAKYLKDQRVTIDGEEYEVVDINILGKRARA